VNPTLQGYAAAVLSDPSTDVATLADELGAVDRAVTDNQALRSALSDNAVPGPSRRAVLEDLLGDRVSPPVRRAAGFAAGAVHGPDVPAALGWLAHRASQAADEGGAPPEPPLIHREARERVAGFAAFVLEDLPVDGLEEVEDELFRFARIVESTPALRGALTDRDLDLAVRRGIVDQLLRSKAQDATVRLVDYVVAGGRARDTVGTLDWLVEQTARARGWRVARVRAAAEVEDAERQQLMASLSRITGSAVELQVTVDPALLAGVVVQVGDLQVDSSALGRLNELREHLSTAGWERPGSDRTGSGSQNEEEGAR